MFNTKNADKTKMLFKIYKDLTSIYTLTEIGQEALDLCRENEKNCHHITMLIDIILDKFKRVLNDLESYTKNSI